ncbi:CBS domain-containing protein [Labilibaculum sp. A4]|uniref:ATP-binding protein n=1 Tax=Labilibaculum euxinus TaxID=2686357 RepID=UPI000F62461E|nr:ATP-binding protein [Labilibaculum euxinus]MDQ1772491.1 ATP-binding protein [Labilibaculum euxinus]MWN78224.1 CBS domain-containing protein [Labilibaculum euxinus]
MKVEHLIRKKFITTNPYSGINEIKNLLLKNNAIVVQDEEKFYGVLTPIDIIQKPRTLAIDCLTVKTLIDSEQSIEKVLSSMKFDNSDVLPVSKNDTFIGLVFKNDLFNYLTDYNEELENKIKERTIELEKAIGMKDLMYSIIAHDLRNPFNSIIGFADLLIENISTYNIDKIKHQIKQISSQSKKAYILLDNLLNWALSQTNHISCNPGFCNLDLITKEVIEQLKISIQIKDITLRCFHSQNIFAYADKNMVETIFRNLISNAIKYSNEGGEINIYSYLQDNNYIEITISDTGIGLSESEKSNIFNIEQVISKPGTADEKGVGLGLLICKEFVEMQGGQIWLENKTDEGCEFKFTLPVYGDLLV